MTTVDTHPASSTRRRAKRGERGFSFVEVLMATVLMAYAVSTIDALFIAGQQKAVLNSNPVTARLLANEIRILARLLPTDPSGVLGVTNAVDIVALDSLQGATFSPPILADRSTYDDLSDWSQSVELSTVELDKPGAIVKDLSAGGAGKEVARVFRLAVTIAHDGETVDEFSWFLRP